MANIHVQTGFNYNKKVIGSQDTKFGGGSLGSTATKNPNGVDFKSEFKKSDPTDYNFLAYDGSIAASGKPHRTSDYDSSKITIVYNEGCVGGPDVVDVASN